MWLHLHNDGLMVIDSLTPSHTQNLEMLLHLKIGRPMPVQIWQSRVQNNIWVIISIFTIQLQFISDIQTNVAFLNFGLPKNISLLRNVCQLFDQKIIVKCYLYIVCIGRLLICFWNRNLSMIYNDLDLYT